MLIAYTEQAGYSSTPAIGLNNVVTSLNNSVINVDRAMNVRARPYTLVQGL